MKQIYETMKGFSQYEISRKGIIRKIVSKEIISMRVHPIYRYTMCDLQDNDLIVRTAYLHKELARNFIRTRKKGKLYVIHINGNPHDNSIKNLKWATPSEAQAIQIKLGIRKKTGNPEIYKFSKYWKAKHAAEINAAKPKRLRIKKKNRKIYSTNLPLNPRKIKS